VNLDDLIIIGLVILFIINEYELYTLRKKVKELEAKALLREYRGV
jgi:hypothetical protein